MGYCVNQMCVCNLFLFYLFINKKFPCTLHNKTHKRQKQYFNKDRYYRLKRIRCTVNFNTPYKFYQHSLVNRFKRYLMTENTLLYIRKILSYTHIMQIHF